MENKDNSPKKGNLFCPICKSMLSISEKDNKRYCKRCTMPEDKKKKKNAPKNLESLVLKFEEVNGDSKRIYEFIFTDSISDIKRLSKNPDNYVLCRCEPYDNGDIMKGYVSLRFFMEKGTYSRLNKILYMSNVPCQRNCGQDCTFYLSEKSTSVIKKMDKYRNQFKRLMPDLIKGLSKE